MRFDLNGSLLRNAYFNGQFNLGVLSMVLDPVISQGSWSTNMVVGFNMSMRFDGRHFYVLSSLHEKKLPGHSASYN